MQQRKWFTETQYVDIETGEQITKQEATKRKRYAIKSRDINIRYTDTTAIKQITYKCKKTGQIELFNNE